MVSKFGQLDRAIAYLCQSVLAQDELWTDVVFVPDGVTLAQQTLLPRGRLRTAVELFCRRFQEASVVCDVRCDGYCIAGIQCRCPEHALSRCHKGCLHHHNRPLVSVVLCPTEEPVEEGLRAGAVRLIHDAIHAFQLDEKKKRDRHRPHTMHLSS